VKILEPEDWRTAREVLLILFFPAVVGYAIYRKWKARRARLKLAERVNFDDEATLTNHSSHPVTVMFPGGRKITLRPGEALTESSDGRCRIVANSLKQNSTKRANSHKTDTDPNPFRDQQRRPFH
jgi:hypothetical protein